MGRLTHIHMVCAGLTNLRCPGASEASMCEPWCRYSGGGGGERQRRVDAADAQSKQGEMGRGRKKKSASAEHLWLTES